VSDGSLGSNKTFLYYTLASRGLRLKFSSFHMFLCGNISADDCARELLKPSKDSANLHVCNEKKILGFCFFVSDVTTGVVLDLFSPLYMALGQSC